MADEHDLLRQLISENVNRTLIYEGLIFSYPPSTIFRKLNGMGYDASYHGKLFSIIFPLSKENGKKYEELNGFMDNLCGWQHGATIAGQVMKDKMGFLKEPVGNVFLQYEPKFDVEVSKLPPFLYHLTTLGKLNKISKTGLVPKSSNNFFSFENRIYLSRDIKSLYDFIKNKFFTNNRENEKEFIILQVSTKSAIRFFEDPNFIQGVYTLENIDRWSIKPIENIELNEQGDIVKIDKL